MCSCQLCFFFNAPTTTEIYTLSLHDALPIGFTVTVYNTGTGDAKGVNLSDPLPTNAGLSWRSEEHTSELQSRPHLVCRLLLEKKKLILLDLCMPHRLPCSGCVTSPADSNQSG